MKGEKVRGEMELSYSKLSLLLRCARAFDFRYIQKLRTPLQSFLYLGGSCHFALAENFRFKINAKKDMSLEKLLDCFSDAWGNGSYFEDEEPGEVDWQGEDPGYVKDVGVEILRSYHRELAPKVEPLAVELLLERSVNDVLLRGRVDLIRGEGVPLDFKTARRKKSQDELDRDLQPTVYTLLLGGPSPFEFHFLLKTKVPAVLLSQTHRTQKDIDWFTRELLPKAAAQISAGIFPPNPTGFLCSPDYCVFYDVCGRPRQF